MCRCSGFGLRSETGYIYSVSSINYQSIYLVWNWVGMFHVQSGAGKGFLAASLGQGIKISLPNAGQDQGKALEELVTHKHTKIL